MRVNSKYYAPGGDSSVTRATDESRCPLCGAHVQYRGFVSIECGSVESCPNFRRPPPPPDTATIGFTRSLAFLESGVSVLYSARPGSPGAGILPETWYPLRSKDLEYLRGLDAAGVDREFIFRLG